MYYLPDILYYNYYNKRCCVWIVNVREFLCYFSGNKRNFFDIFYMLFDLYNKSDEKLHLLCKILRIILLLR